MKAKQRKLIEKAVLGTSVICMSEIDRTGNSVKTVIDYARGPAAAMFDYNNIYVYEGLLTLIPIGLNEYIIRLEILDNGNVDAVIEGKTKFIEHTGTFEGFVTSSDNTFVLASMGAKGFSIVIYHEEGRIFKIIQDEISTPRGWLKQYGSPELKPHEFKNINDAFPVSHSSIDDITALEDQ